ncbi:MAG TPA: hypothetical protein VGH28_03110 [Polyangiaceae bacterium]|jgi:hypothetical protein
MAFGKNPHIAKAQQEEQKALDARDERAAELAWREAARQWDRAAAREADSKRRDELAAKAEAARKKADGEDEPPPVPGKLLN